MAQLTQSVGTLIDQLSKLPGIGKKSAERLAYHVLRVHKSEALALADAIRDVRENVRYCKTCYNLSEQEECLICRDPRRDRNWVQLRDAVAFPDRRRLGARVIRQRQDHHPGHRRSHRKR